MEAGKSGRDGDANEALRRSLPTTNTRSRGLKVAENVHCRLVKVSPRVSHGDGTRGAVNQFGAKLIFKAGDLFADSWLSNSTFLCHSGEASFFNDPDEHLHC